MLRALEDTYDLLQRRRCLVHQHSPSRLPRLSGLPLGHIPRGRGSFRDSHCLAVVDLPSLLRLALRGLVAMAMKCFAVVALALVLGL